MRNEMNEPFSDELLSAYLDGELPREDRARVEDWLTASAEHRRLLEDLKAIRRELQALPKQSLDAGFGDRVLAAIRQRTGEPSSAPPAASDSPPAASGSSTAEVPQTNPLQPVQLPNQHLGMPAWRWFAAGIAATLLGVVVGMNAAPETMAQMGKLAQVVPPTVDRAARKNVASNDAWQRHEDSAASHADAAATPAAANEAPVNVKAAQAAGSSAESRQRDGDNSGEAESKAMRQSVANRDENRQAIAPSEQAAEPQVEAPAPPAPNLVVDPRVTPGAALEAFDKTTSDGRDLASSGLASAAKKLAAEGSVSGQAGATYNDIVELPVTGEQADRALAFYASTIERQAAQRFRNSNVVTLAAPGGDEKAGEDLAEAGNEQTVLERSSLQRSATGMSLIKLMDAATQGVHVAALEVTGPEAEVQALLDSLGVAEARDLRPNREMLFGGGAGSGGALRANREREPASAGAAGKPAAALPGDEIAQADGAAVQEEAQGGRVAPKRAPRDGAKGGFPTVQMRRKGEGNEGVRDAGKESARPGQLGGLAQPQLRVRLVFVPAPSEPASEAKPAE